MRIKRAFGAKTLIGHCAALFPFRSQKGYLTGRYSHRFILFINIWSNTVSSPKPWEISKSGRNNASCRCNFILKCIRRYSGKGRANVLWAFVVSTVKVHALIFKVKVWEETSYPRGKEKFRSRASWWTPPCLFFFPLWVYLSLQNLTNQYSHNLFRFMLSLMLMYGILRIWFLY